MRRLEAARAGDVGGHIVTLPQLASYLAGGFVRPASTADVELAAREALVASGFAEITPIETLPGMVRAVVHTLKRLWRAGVSVEDHIGGHPRLADLAILDARIRAGLSGGARTAPDLVVAALARRHLFQRLVGALVLDHVHYLAPVWRPLIEALAAAVTVEWRDCEPPVGWSVVDAAPSPERPPAVIEAVSCAHPQAEAIEAMRWARKLIASGEARPDEIAIVAASPEAWDDSFLGLAKGATLPFHFSHGIPALCSTEGQTCAALVDVLVQRLSYDRVHRLLAHCAGRCAALPEESGWPLSGISPSAARTTLDQWRHACTIAARGREDGYNRAAILDPVLVLLSEGVSAAALAGERLLPEGAAALWQIALRRAPAEALSFSLSAMRIADGKDPGVNIVWGPAGHLAGAPRPWMRLIGLTSRAWPRPRRDDPLLPDHIFALGADVSPSRPDQDRQRFAVITRGATAGLSFSYARRTPQGGAQAPSPLLPANIPMRRLARLRTPEHAFSESDRLQARPTDHRDDPQFARPVQCARARRARELSAWDGLVRSDHPAIAAALARVQSASSLRQLVRDPQAFVWRYALGWREMSQEAQTLSLDDRAFGDLVHRLLQLTVTDLEAGPGFGRAAPHEVEEAIGRASEQVSREWPAVRAAPPPMLWHHTLQKARHLALTALQLDEVFQPGTRSWTEVAFGDASAGGTIPWDARAPVTGPGTSIAIRGRIDRLELTAADAAIRITDYKTGAAPPNAGSLVLAGGGELQRVLYAIAARSHLPEAPIRADLIYLGDEAPKRHKLDGLATAMERVAAVLNQATALVQRGVSLPGPDEKERWNAYRLARPAIGEPVSKTSAVDDAFGDFRRVWSQP